MPFRTFGRNSSESTECHSVLLGDFPLKVLSSTDKIKKAIQKQTNHIWECPAKQGFPIVEERISRAAKLETQRQPKRNFAKFRHPIHPQMDFNQRDIFHGKRSNKTSSTHKSCGVELARGCPAQRSNVPHRNGLGLNWAETGQGRDQAECGTGLDQAGAMPHLDRAAPGSGCHWDRIQPGRDRPEANRARPEPGWDRVGG